MTKLLLPLILLLSLLHDTAQAQRRLRFVVYETCVQGDNDCDVNSNDHYFSWEGPEVVDNCYGQDNVAPNWCTNPGAVLYDEVFTCASDWPTGALDFTWYVSECDVCGCLFGILTGSDGNLPQSFAFPAAGVGNNFYYPAQQFLTPGGCFGGPGTYSYRGRWEVSGAFLGPYPNDAICSAVTLSVGSSIGSSNNCATVQAGEVDSPDGNVGPSRTMWYSFVAPSSGHVRIQVADNGIGDPEASLWYQPSGCAFNTLQHIVSEDDDVPIFDTDVDMEAECLTPGATYYIQVDGDDASDMGFFVLTVTSVGPPLPTNNDICSSLPITVGTTLSSNNNCATVQGGEVDAASGIIAPSNTVWYHFTAPASGHVNVSTDHGGTSFDTEIAVWQQTNGVACTFNTLSEAGSDDDVVWPFNLSSDLDLQCLTPGARYYIQVDGNDASDYGNFQLSVTNLGGTMATNDLCAQAINLGTLAFNGTLGNPNLSNYTNICAGSAGDPQPPGWGNDQGVWFQFTTSATPSTHITFHGYNDPQSLGDQIDLQLALYRGTCGNLTFVDNDYTPPLYSEDMQVTCLLPNTTYFLLVDGADNLIGGLEGYFGLQIVDEGIAQPGDLICAATNLGTVPLNGQVGTSPLSQSNICATPTNDPDPFAWDPDHSVWYSFIAPPSGSVLLDANSDLPFPLGDDAIDLQLAVYDAAPNTCVGTLTEMESDYDPLLSDEDMEVRCLVPGRRYWVLVDGGGGIGGTQGIFDITISDLMQYPAPNDLICNAINMGQPLPNAPVSVSNQSNYCADNLFEPIPTNWGNDMGVWYTFVAPPSGEVNIYASNNGADDLDLQLAVYDASNMNCTDPLTEVASEWEGLGLINDEDMNVRCLTPGRKYFLLVDGNASFLSPELIDGQFNLQIEATNADPPAVNDLPCDAIALGMPFPNPVGTGPGGSHPSQNNFCTDANGEPTPSGFTANQTVWYSFLAPPTGSVRINAVSDGLFGDNPVDLQLAVFESTSFTCNGPFVEIGGDYDLPSFDEDLDVHCMKAGVLYYLMVDGSDLNVEGYFDITLTEIPPLPIPGNDEICNAVPLGNPFPAGNVGATGEFNICADDLGDPDPTAFDTDQTVWYTFTTPPTGGPFAVNIDAISDLPWPIGDDAVDLQVAVFESSNNACNGAFTEMGSEYDIFFFDESIEVQCLEANHTYYVMIDGSPLNVQGYFDIFIEPITALPIPTNDNICAATNLGTVPIGGAINTNTNYFNFCATTEAGEPSPYGIDQTVWFTFTTPPNGSPTATSNITVLVNSDPNNQGDAVDLQMAVFESSNGTCSGSMGLLDYSDNILTFNGEVNLTCLRPGTTYWVQVDGSALNVEGYFTIQIQDDGFGNLPANDDLCNATALGAVPNGGTLNPGTIFHNFCATVENGEPVPGAFGLDQTVWFTFVAPTSGNVTIQATSDPNNQGDEIDLQVAVWDSPNGTCAGPFLEHESDYDIFSYDEDVTVSCLEPGQTYWIQVDGTDNLIGGIQGYFGLQLFDDGGATSFPYNNDICNAYDFNTLTGTPETLINEDNICANLEIGEPGLGIFAEHTVWYSFIAPFSGRVEIIVDGNQFIGGIDPEVHLYSSSNNSCTGNLSEIGSSYIPGNHSILIEDLVNSCLVPGNRYFIQIDGSSVLGPMGDFTISILDPEPLYGTGQPGDPEPPNNECAGALPLLVQDESCFIGNGTFEIENYGEPTVSLNSPYVQSCNPNGNCGDTWYSFVMPNTGIALIEGNDDDISAPFPGLGDFSDLTIVAYTGGCGSLSPIRCGAGGLGTDISYQVTAPAGTTVYVQVFDGGGDDNTEDFEICVSEACGADNCLDAIAVPMLPNIPYCFETESSSGEDVVNGAPGYSECSQGQTNDSPEHSVYYSFVSDCNGSSLTVSVINATFGSGCFLGVPTDALSISLFSDATPCDNNPDILVDCQNFDNCSYNTVNWSFTYNNLQPNTNYILQLEGGIGNVTGGDVNGFVMINTSVNPTLTAVPDLPTCGATGTGNATATPGPGTGTPPFTYLWDNSETAQTATSLSYGTHNVTATDVNGCTATASVFIDSMPPPAPITATATTVCKGASVQFGVVPNIAGTSYQWSGPGNYSNSGPYPDLDNADPIMNGTYTVTATYANGCVLTGSVQVTVNPCLEICGNGVDDDGDGMIDTDDPDCPCGP